jgi:hypothetical protein
MPMATFDHEVMIDYVEMMDDVRLCRHPDHTV